MAMITSSVLTQEFVSMLAMELLPRPDDQYPFYQFGPIQRQDDKAQMPGTQILFDRLDLPSGALYTEASRRGTEGTAINTGNLGITMTQVPLTVREYLGPHDGTNVVPYGITEFMAKRAKHDLLGIIGNFLRLDRVKFLNRVIMDLLLAATIVTTPTGVAEGAITAGVPASAAWLRAWNKVMKDNKIPTYANGRWRLWITTKQEAEILADTEYREANRYLVNANPAFTGQIGIYAGFDIGVSTVIPTKGVGSGGAVTGYQAVAYGPLGIGHGVAMDATPAQDTNTDFGRQERVIWKSHETFGTLEAELLTRGITT